jgi:hypothetical protein
MSNLKDVVIGCITNYTFDKIQLFVNSLEQSGFDGYKVMIIYNVPFSTVDELEKRGWIVLSFNKDENNKYYTYRDNFIVTVDRHLHYHLAINNLNEEFGNLRYVMAIDPRDVIFQSNPSIWLENNLKDKKLNVGCESLKYKDEWWGRDNLKDSFGETVYERLQNTPIYNAGTIAGEWNYLSELSLNIYLLCQGSSNGTPDQAALNILLSLQPYKDITNFAMSEDGWACQAGTTADPLKINNYKNYLLEHEPYFDINDGLVKTSKDDVFALVHQYDRVPMWDKIINEKYKI